MKRVLVIDDSPTVCKIIEICLGRAGYEVVCCPDGVRAAQWLQSNNACIPDLIFVDLELPQWDGYSIIRHLRSQPALSKTTFAIMSRRNGPLDMLKGRLVGASVYMVKPFVTQDLLSVTQKYLPA